VLWAFRAGTLNPVSPLGDTVCCVAERSGWVVELLLLWQGWCRSVVWQGCGVWALWRDVLRCEAGAEGVLETGA